MAGKKKYAKLKTLFVVLAIAAAGSLAAAGIARGADEYQERTQSPLVFSDKKMLYELWQAYKAEKLERGTGRTLDASMPKNVTTSEGVSYTMLRAVWMDDKVTFDQSLQWSKDNLQRADFLFSWKFGQRADGSYGILVEDGGQNTASDADADIALALLMAYQRWGEGRYIGNAQQIIKAIWDNEVVTVGGKPVLLAGAQERHSAGDVIVNPSYFAPYSFKLFAKADPDKTHDWLAVADSSYAIIRQSLDSPIDKQTSAGLPPNYLVMDRTSGTIRAAYPRNHSSDYGYDALRTPWRLALDWLWFKDARSKDLLERMAALKTEWQTTGTIAAVYGHDGARLSTEKSYATYGTFLAYLSVTDATVAKEVYNRILTPLYNPDTQSWRSTMGYYDDNWVWFGLALHADQLPNLALESGKPYADAN